MADPNLAPMTERARANLQRHRQSLIDDLDSEFIVDQLISDFALVPDEVELIMSKATRRRRAVTFLNLVSTKGQNAYNSTYKALAKMQPHLALFLEDAVTGRAPLVKGESLDGLTKAQADVVLRKGGVPVPPAVFTPRPEVLEAIRGALHKLTDQTGWVVVHGMGGIGKSVLAAAALRDVQILSETFPGGLFWLQVGNMDKTKLLLKVQNLCARLEEDGERTPPHNLEEGKDRLRTLFLEKHPRSLLILDDVWSTKVINVFDVQARVMVTTRDRSVTDRVMGQVYRVPLESGFSEEQALKTLAAWTHRDVESLPPEATQIYQASKGSPLVISIVGALLADHPHRWKYYLDKLRDKKYGRLRKVTAYEYQSVGEAMGMSLEQLSAELRNLYSSFAIFCEDIQIPATVLAIMHNDEQESIEDMMEEIINKSLAFQEWDKTLQCMVYTLHDLQLDFLTEQYKDDIQDMHKKLVAGFKRHCNGDYHLLKDDSYIHMYLASHMAQGEDYDELVKLLTSLPWITKKIMITGPANMLSDYVSYKNLLPKQHREVVDQFQSFISVNAHRLVQSPLPDMLQLALVQPDDTDVCKQARALVKAKGTGFYVEWCNKYLVKHTLLMTSTPHSGVTQSAHFSPAGDKILSCGEDGTIKVWCSQSGKLAYSLEAHTDWVDWCEMSPDGEMIVSCGGDSCAKVWNAKDRTLLQKISGTWYRVIFSHDSQKIALCTTEGNIKIFNPKSGERLADFCAHNSAIRSICFSPNDKYILSSSDDSTVVVSDASTGATIITYTGHEVFVMSCSCSADGSHVASAAYHEVHVWELETGKHVGKCLSEANSVLCCEFSPKGDVIAGGLSNFEIVLWETKRYKPVAVFTGHTSWVQSVKFDIRGDKLVSASDDETVMIWKVGYGHKDLKSVWKRDFIACFCDSEKRLEFVIAGDNKNRCLMTDGRQSDQTFVLSQESSRMRTFALTKDKKKVVFGSDAGGVKVVDLVSRSVEHQLDGHKREVRSCLFTQDGSTVITCSNDKTIKIWREGQETIECNGHTDAVTRCQLFKNDTRLLSSSRDGTLRVWDVASGRHLATMTGHDDWVFTCQVSPDETMAVSVSVDKTAKVWDLESLKMTQSLENHIDSVRTCRFSQDSELLATGDDSGIIKVWNARTGHEIGTCRKHKSWVTDIRFSPDRKIIVTAGENVRWWLLDGTPLQTFHIRGSFIRQVQANDTFSTFVTIDSAGILYLMCRVEACKQDDNAREVVFV